MKKSVLFMIALVASTALFAQKSAVNSAYSHYRNQYWDKAKASIDKACLSPDTKDDAKTWMFKGNIYAMLATSKKYSKLCENPVDEAYDAFMKAVKLNPEIKVDMGLPTPSRGLKHCSNLFYNLSIDEFNKGDYAKAAAIAEKSHMADPTSEDACYLYGYASELAGDTKTAIKQYSAITKANKKSAKREAFMHLAALYQAENDTAKALRVIKARSVLKDTTPLDKITDEKRKAIVDYATVESVIYMWAGESEMANSVMEKALALDPNNYVMLVNTGLKLLEQKNYNKAEDFLLKANDLKPNDFDILFNIGLAYMKHHATAFESLQTDEISNNDNLYDMVKDSCDMLLKKALPYLEQAEVLQPNDYNTLLILKQIYPYLSDDVYKAKLEAVNAKFNVLEAERKAAAKQNQ